MTMGAKVYDISAAHVRRTLDAQQSDAAAAAIIDDVADGIEAVHQLANCAGFSERPRAFILALLSAARSRDNTQVELFDDELAALQNCSTKTVQRQRVDYFKEARGRGLHLIEIVEGEFVKAGEGSGKNRPTRYRFHLGGAVEKIVTLARTSTRWHESDRRMQRAAIARAAVHVFDEIPRAESRARKKRKTRPIADEIETCLKMASAKLLSAQQLASKLSAPARAKLLDENDPRGLRRRWWEMRTAMDALFEDSLQATDSTGVDEGGGQLVSEPVDEDGFKSGASAEQRETWERRFAGLSEPPVLCSELHPRPLPSEEDEEAVAIRDEGCRRL